MIDIKVCQKYANNKTLSLKRLRVFCSERELIMNEVKNLPNLAKQVQKTIGKVNRENAEVQRRAMMENYDISKDPTLYQVKFDGLHSKELFITKSAHKAFDRLLEKVQLVFNAENVEYDIDQVSTKLEKFIEDIVSNNESYDLEMINNFIKEIKTPEYVIYFFRLFNFEYKEKINLGSNILIISGRELLRDIPNAEDLNRKAEKNPKFKRLIQSDDILLGVSVIDSGKKDTSYYRALESANNINNIINFLNGFNHKASQILELSQHIIQEDGIYQFTNKSGHFYNKQTPGILEGGWTTSTGINPDKRHKANMKFDKRWMPIIPLIVEDSSELTPLQKQCARAIDWIGDAIVNSNQTKQFLQIMISLETMIEQDPDKLQNRLKKDNLWNDNLSVSIEDQLVSIMNLICYPNVKLKQLKKNDAAIKRAYELRSRITHDGEKFPPIDATEMLDRWYSLVYTIITDIMFAGRWNNVYDLWKAANLKQKDNN